MLRMRKTIDQNMYTKILFIAAQDPNNYLLELNECKVIFEKE